MNETIERGIMPVVKMQARSAPDAELEQVVQLAVSLSGRLTRLQLDDIPAAIAEALDQLAAATHVDGCRLLEFTAAGSVARLHVPLSCTRQAEATPQASVPEEWLFARLARGEGVRISGSDELPREAAAAREPSGRRADHGRS
jgi:hypothetical protein